MGRRRQRLENDDDAELLEPRKRQKTFKFKKLGQRIAEVSLLRWIFQQSAHAAMEHCTKVQVGIQARAALLLRVHVLHCICNMCMG